MEPTSQPISQHTAPASNLKLLAALTLLLVTLLTNCSGGKMEANKVVLPSMKAVPAESWQKLAQKRIFFGHQSVGYNIIDGIQDIMRENPQIKINLVETSRPSDFNTAVFAHSAVGENGNPKSKSDAFAHIMAAGVGEKVDIAFFKFCYVDFDLNTDVARMFDQYRSTMQQLQKEYPKVTFIHLTAPLTTPPTGLVDRAKRLIKIIIGRPIASIEDNVKRDEYNALLRKEFGNQGTVFDLAATESTYPDGGTETFNRNGKTYPSLVPQYTVDGGHLDETGRKVVAEQLLIFLAGLSK